MSDLRGPGEHGRYMPTMHHICGFDDGDTSAPVCGLAATIHAYAGSPSEGPSDWTMFACEAHAAQAKALAWDFHDVGAVCDVPDSIWQAKPRQGEGFCFWPDAEAAIHEVVAETVVLTP